MSLHRVTFTGTYFNQLIQNVVHFENPDGAQTQEQMANELKTDWLQKINEGQNSLMIWRSIRVHECPTNAHVPFNLNFTMNIGPSQSDGYPSVLSVIYSLRSGVAGRRGRGRFYVTALINGAIVQNVMNAAYLTQHQTIAGVLLSRFGATGSSNMILKIAPRNATGVLDSVTVSNIICQGNLGIQRRRNQAVGM